jgi:3-dehydroquinate dehydratase / shikimate dehydrogenase
MTQLCAPVKKLVSTDVVHLQEIDRGTHKELYHNEELLYVDTDWRSPSFQSRAKTIISYHNFQETPELGPILHQLQTRHPKAYFYKIATYAQSTLDSLRMLDFLSHHKNVIGLCMGPLGSITRILAPIFEVPIAYAPLSDEEISALGQIVAKDLHAIYHFSRLNPQTQIYGLIGDPIDQSPGHLFHNLAFRHQNAVYVKMRLKPAELKDFLALAKKLSFKGLSVTMPLKELVLPERGPINTLVFEDKELTGYNTDGLAVFDLLGPTLGKTVCLLGAGGTAKAIIQTLDADIVVVNRTPSKAKLLAQTLGCRWSLKPPRYDILINATSSPMPICEADILPNRAVLDVAHQETELIEIARTKGCRIFTGLQLYLRQAALQHEIWQQSSSSLYTPPQPLLLKT